MMRLLFTFLIASFSMSLSAQESIYNYTVQNIDGEEVSMETFKGKKILLVNVASKCGYTPQYEELQKLYDKYSEKDFVVVAFPANNFMKQEPGSNSEIKAFCTEEYGVTFPVMSKISVKGDDQAPIYTWLTSKEMNGVADSKVKWNFQKYCIDAEGNLVTSFAPSVSPMDKTITDWIEE